MSVTTTTKATTTTTAPPIVTVDAGDLYFFVPMSVTVAKGTTVVWGISSGYHSITSGTGGTPDGKFDSGLVEAGRSFAWTFPTAGTFSYFCTLDWQAGMVGTVTVTG